MPRERTTSGHPILYYLRNFRFHSVLFRYYVLVFLFFYVPFVAAVIGVTTHYSNRVREQIEATYSDRVEQVGDLISSALRGTEISLFQFSRSESFVGFVESAGLERPGYDMLVLYGNLTRELQQQQSTRATFYVVSFDNGFWLGSNGNRGRLGDPGSPIDEGEFEQTDSDWIRVDFDHEGIRVVRPVARTRGGPVNGVVLVQAYTAAILEDARAASLDDRTAIYLLAPTGEIIDSDTADRAQGLIENITPVDLIESSEGGFHVVAHGDDEYALFSSELHRGFVSVVAVPTERFLSTVRATNRVIFIVAGLMGVLMVPLVFAIAVHLYNPVKQLFELVEETERATRSELANNQNYDEIRFIKDNMVRSLDRQRELETELERRVAMLNRAQVLALQSQISPHFLNNTLSTISWLTMNLTGGENQATRVVNDLSNLLRSTLESDRILTTIREELDHARTYIDIQKVRYKGLLEVWWEVPDDLLEEQIVRVTLQPLMENAIYHGVKPRKHGTILVRGSRQQNTVLLEVIDDGTGVSEERARVLNRTFEAEYAVPEDHIGLANVNQRLRLVFGAEFGLTIHPGESHGTKVKITLPASSQPHPVMHQGETYHTYS